MPCVELSDDVPPLPHQRRRKQLPELVFLKLLARGVKWLSGVVLGIPQYRILTACIDKREVYRTLQRC